MNTERWFWLGILALVMFSIALLSVAFRHDVKRDKYCRAHGGIYYQFRGGAICVKENSQIDMP